MPTHFSLPEYFLRVKSLTTWDYGYVGLRWYFYQLKKLGRLTVCLLQAPWIGLAWQQRAGASMWHSAQRLEYILCNVQAVQTRIRLLYSNSKWLTEHKSHWSQQVSTIVATKLCVGSLVPRLLPCRKTGREPGRTDHVPRDVLCVVLCVVLNYCPRSPYSASVVGVLDPWISLRLQMGTGRLFHCYLTRW